MIKRALYLLTFLIYLCLVVAPLFFPYLVIRGFDKTHAELLKPLHYFASKID